MYIMKLLGSRRVSQGGGDLGGWGGGGCRALKSVVCNLLHCVSTDIFVSGFSVHLAGRE